MSNNNNTNDLQKAEKAVAAAEAVVSDLQSKRAAAVARIEEIAATRKKLGFAVHAGGDKGARVQLDKLNLEDATLAGEQQSLDGALAEAGHRLQAAQQAVARETERVRLLDLKKQNDEMRKLGPWMDEAVADYVGGLRGLLKVSGLGLPHPSSGQQVLMLYRCLLVALRGTPWEREFGVADSNDKRTFGSHASIIDQWCNANERDLKYRLAELAGAQPKMTEEAA